MLWFIRVSGEFLEQIACWRCCQLILRLFCGSVALFTFGLIPTWVACNDIMRKEFIDLSLRSVIDTCYRSARSTTLKCHLKVLRNNQILGIFSYNVEIVGTIVLDANNPKTCSEQIPNSRRIWDKSTQKKRWGSSRSLGSRGSWLVSRLLGSLQFSFGADFLELAMRYSNFKRIFQGCQLQLGKRLGYF